MQQVNLFQASFRWEDDALPSSMILKVVAGAIAFSLLLYAITWARSASIIGEANDQIARMQHLTAQMAEFSERASSRVEDKALSARVVALREQLDAKKRLLAALSGRGEGNSDGFSSHLRGLALHKVDGVWLRSIRLDKGGASLKVVGSTLAPEGVPELLQQLGKEASFSGRQFRTFRLETSGERLGAIDFVIGTDSEDAS